MKYIPLLVFLLACNPMFWKAAEDGVVGEIQVAEQVATDLGATAPQSPGVKIPVKKF